MRTDAINLVSLCEAGFSWLVLQIRGSVTCEATKRRDLSGARSRRVRKRFGAKKIWRSTSSGMPAPTRRPSVLCAEKHSARN